MAHSKADLAALKKSGEESKAYYYRIADAFRRLGNAHQLAAHPKNMAFDGNGKFCGVMYGNKSPGFREIKKAEEALAEISTIDLYEDFRLGPGEPIGQFDIYEASGLSLTTGGDVFLRGGVWADDDSVLIGFGPIGESGDVFTYVKLDPVRAHSLASLLNVATAKIRADELNDGIRDVSKQLEKSSASPEPAEEN